MYLTETLKHSVEQATGLGRPSAQEVQAARHERKPRTHVFEDDGAIPNNPDLPFVIYKNVLALEAAKDPAALFEELFAANGWQESWRNGIYDYVHYHSSIHEVLGIARGRAQVRFGGTNGREIVMEAGDVAILPAGTGHQCLMASDDFLVVGAYPATGKYDECRGAAEEHRHAKRSIPRVPRPAKDPVYGPAGPLRSLWR
jgi:uncharacterized protein YjlB